MEAKATKKKRNPVFLIILALLVIGGGWFGFSKYQHSLHHEDTDDAQVSGDISPVIPRIAGYITGIKVNDNVRVKKGDTLLILDNRDYVIKVEQAEAALQGRKSQYCDFTGFDWHYRCANRSSESNIVAGEPGS